MKIYSPIDAAKVLEFNDDSTVRKLILKGKLKARKVGKQWILTDKDLRQFNGNVLVILEGGLIECKNGWRYYHGSRSSPKIMSGIYLTKEHADDGLVNQLLAAKIDYKGSPNYVVVIKKKPDIILDKHEKSI